MEPIRQVYTLRHKGTGYQMGKWILAVHAYDACRYQLYPLEWEVVALIPDPLEHLVGGRG